MTIVKATHLYVLVVVLMLGLLVPAPGAEALACNYESGQSTVDDWAYAVDLDHDCTWIQVRHKYSERGYYFWTSWDTSYNGYARTPEIPELVQHETAGN